MAIPEASRPLDFIRQIVADDLEAGKYTRIMTRFPPSRRRSGWEPFSITFPATA